MENAIVVNDLTKEYEGFLLDHLTFAVPKGTIVGFIGENGAGKSTTMKAMLGLMPIEAGEVTLLGHKIEQGEKDFSYKEQIGVVFDECNFPEYLKVKYVSKIMKQMYQTWDEYKFLGYLKRFELPENKKVRELSKGMKMKLSIAVALSHDSRLLILDEATSGLDPVIRNELLNLFREFTQDEEHTIFISSHITSDIEKIADYILFIHKGKLLMMESKDELLYRYAILKCSKRAAELIPEELIAGRRDGEFSVNILINDREKLDEDVFRAKAEDMDSGPVVIEKISMEELFLYLIAKEVK